MSRTSILGSSAILLVLVQAACSTSSSTTAVTPTVVADTLGEQFSVSCSTSYCTLTSLDLNVKPLSCEYAYGTDNFILVPGSILTVMALQITQSGDIPLNNADPAHPVACSSDADCLSPGYTVTVGSNNTSMSFSCLDGICRLPGQALLTSDVIALCQHDIDWPTSCPYVAFPKFAARMDEVALSCGSTTYCSTVPADCQPPFAPAPLDGGAGGLDAGGTTLDAGATSLDTSEATLDAGGTSVDTL
jgi:hypothetical protein